MCVCVCDFVCERARKLCARASMVTCDTICREGKEDTEMGEGGGGGGGGEERERERERERHRQDTLPLFLHSQLYL